MTSRLRLLGSYLRTRRLMQPGRWPSRDALEAWQDRQVRHHLARVVERSAFHRERFAGMADWRSVSTVSKVETMAHFDDANTVGVRLKDALAVAVRAERERDFEPLLPGGIAVGLSSGTSGHRGVFLASAAERDAWAGAILARVLPTGGLLRRHRVAFFLRASSALYSRVGSTRITFDYHDLLDPLYQHVDRLNASPPSILVAPPSVLRMLASETGGVLRIAPERVVSVAEVLDDVDRSVIETAFGAPVHQVYQATEGFLGVTCSEGTLHLNEAHLMVEREMLDDVRFTPIVTDFSRDTQPVLRQALDDVLVLRETPCPCGSLTTALSRIEGRRDDAFVLPSIAGSTPVTVFADFIRRAVLLGADQATAYTAHQHANGCIDVSIRVRDDERDTAEAGVREELERLWATVGAVPPCVTFVAPLPDAFGPVKVRRVTRERPSEASPAAATPRTASTPSPPAAAACAVGASRICRDVRLASNPAPRPVVTSCAAQHAGEDGADGSGGAARGHVDS